MAIVGVLVESQSDAERDRCRLYIDMRSLLAARLFSVNRQTRKDLVAIVRKRLLASVSPFDETLARRLLGLRGARKT